MSCTKMLWKAWYGDETLELTFPQEWDVHFLPPKDGQPLCEEEIKKAIQEPISCRPIAELAQGKKTAAIAVDDISRPTPIHKILPHVVRELERGGIRKEHVCIIIALGAHRPMTRDDCLKKLGTAIVSTYRIYNHHPYENLVDLGVSQGGTPVKINRLFAEADLKIGIGCITPHGMVGFGGGGKIVLPGIASIETVAVNHQPYFTPGENFPIRTGFIEGNKIREDIDDIARIAGLNFIVNAVMSSERNICALFAGDSVSAYREAVKSAKRTYSTQVEENFDIGIFNAYPKDTELIQASNAFNVYKSSQKNIVREKGAIVIVSASSEGKGFHSLSSEGMRLHTPLHRDPGCEKIIKNKKIILFSPNLSRVDIEDLYPRETTLARSWEQVLVELKKTFTKKPTVAVFPCASLQLGEG